MIDAIIFTVSFVIQIVAVSFTWNTFVAPMGVPQIDVIQACAFITARTIVTMKYVRKGSADATFDNMVATGASALMLVILFVLGWLL